jgi:hypothetical protein
VNDFLVGIQAALKEYPIVGDDFERAFEWRSDTQDPHRECLYLILDVYKQYERGHISSKQVLWALGKLCELLKY